MRWLLIALVTLCTSTPGAWRGVQADSDNRQRVVATLEHLMATGEPHHTSHDAGEWLQAEVDRAFARNDVEVMRLAQRAAAPIVAEIAMPVSASGEPVALTFRTRPVLAVKPAVAYRADVRVSVDGGEAVRLGTLDPDQEKTFADKLPAAALGAGQHHLRITAYLTFPAGSGLPPETRPLPDVVYARYDRESTTAEDSSSFIASAPAISARQLDTALPPVPLEAWLEELARRHGGKYDATQWRSSYCDARTAEAGKPASGREICAVIDFALPGAIVRMWIRTGRIEGTGTGVKWLKEAPAFQGMMVGGLMFQSLASLPDLLASPRETWPSGDVEVAPEDMTITTGDGLVRLSATVRNAGPGPLYGVLLTAGISTGHDRGSERRLVFDLPANGSKTVDVELPLLSRYAVIMVQAMQLGEHAPYDTWTPDPTPDNSVAFRIVNPGNAPRAYAHSIKAMCGPCRGF